MVTQVTKGIKISVETGFEGNYFKDGMDQFAFSYRITIENQSKKKVQLLARHWQIFDSLNAPEVVDGEGVIGQQPVLESGATHTYTSGCLLSSSIGAMRGYYQMTDLENGNTFKVFIPTFKLCTPATLN